MKKYIAIFIFLCGSFLNFSFDQQDSFVKMVNSELSFAVPVIKVGELRRMIKDSSDIILIDIRTEAEYNVSHLENAIWIGEKTKKDLSFSKESVIVLYCSIGYRSEKAGEVLMKNGYKKVYNLWGGIFDWINKGYPLVDMQENPTENIHPYSEEWGKWIIRGIKKYE